MNNRINVAFSFDDGRDDNYEVAHRLVTDFGYRATFNISTAYVDGSILPVNKPCDNKNMSVSQIIDIYREGHEIASHGDQHLNTLDDISKGVEKLREWIPNIDSEIGFASPRSDMRYTDVQKIKGELDKIGISYVRLGIRPSNASARNVKKALRGAARATGSKLLYGAAFESSLLERDNIYLKYSIPIMHYATIEQIIYLVGIAKKKNKDCILMFHSIIKKGDNFYEDNWSWDYDDFFTLCELVRSDGSIEVRRVCELGRKMDDISV